MLIILYCHVTSLQESVNVSLAIEQHFAIVLNYALEQVSRALSQQLSDVDYQLVVRHKLVLPSVYSYIYVQAV